MIDFVWNAGELPEPPSLDVDCLKLVSIHPWRRSAIEPHLPGRDPLAHDELLAPFKPVPIWPAPNVSAHRQPEFPQSPPRAFYRAWLRVMKGSRQLQIKLWCAAVQNGLESPWFAWSAKNRSLIFKRFLIRRSVDIVGVAGSIPAAPTTPQAGIEKPPAVGSDPAHDAFACLARVSCPGRGEAGAAGRRAGQNEMFV